MYKRNAAMGQQVSTASSQKTLDNDDNISVSAVSVECKVESSSAIIEKTSSTVTIPENERIEHQNAAVLIEIEIESSNNINSPALGDDEKVKKHPYEDSSSTNLICFDDRNLVFNYAQLHDKIWKRSLDKFVRLYILNDKPIHQGSSTEASTILATTKTASIETKNNDFSIEKLPINSPESDPNIDTTLPSSNQTNLTDIQQQIEYSLSLETARNVLRDCAYVQLYIKRQRKRLFGNANRFPYEATSIALVFSFLDAWTLLQVTQVNRLWRDTAYEDVCHCWEHLLRTDFHVSSESIRLNVQRRQQLLEEENLRAEKQRLKDEKARIKEEKRRKREEALLQKQRALNENQDKVEIQCSAGANAEDTGDISNMNNVNNITGINDQVHNSSSNNNNKKLINNNINNNCFSNYSSINNRTTKLYNNDRIDTRNHNSNGNNEDNHNWDAQQDPLILPRHNPEPMLLALRVREKKVYEVVTLSSPVAQMIPAQNRSAELKSSNHAANTHINSTINDDYANNNSDNNNHSNVSSGNHTDHIILDNNTANASAAITSTPPQKDVPFPPSYYSNARSRWAKEMYRDMYFSYHHLTTNQNALFRQPPVVPLQWLIQSGSTLF